MADFVIKSGDSLPLLEATLLDADNIGIILTGASLRVRIRKAGKEYPDLVDNATIVSTVAGTVKYDWNGPVPLEPGIYYGEWLVTFSDSTVETFPNVFFFTLQVTKNLLSNSKIYVEHWPPFLSN